ncbi:MAG TPA: beta-ketoacyl-ACP synthase II [Armatimonadota bacterium]|nr:beta-ketoacyl-ACP synthase II [Armatimonadota bacterium]
MHRVVITGMGCVTPIGIGVAETWESLLAGRSGIDHISSFDASKYSVRIAGEVKNFDPTAFLDRKAARRLDRFVQLAHAAAAEAIEASRLPINDATRARIGVIIGSGIGGMNTLEREHAALLERGPDRVSPFFIPMMISNMAAGHLSMHFGVEGPGATVVSACASASHAIGVAFDLVRAGQADAIITGGTEATVTPLALAGFSNMKALSTCNDTPQEACKPLDARRDGFVMAEGAGILVVESLEHAEKRGATIEAELCGVGMSSDAYHITAPCPDGAGGRRAMEACLRVAGADPEEIDYINCHAPGTPAGDESEAIAIRALFGENARVAIGSTKSMHGHLLGAAGAVELIATIRSVQAGVILPTRNLREPDPACEGLDCVMDTVRSAPIRAALSNSFGFGGQNACAMVRRV